MRYKEFLSDYQYRVTIVGIVVILSSPASTQRFLNSFGIEVRSVYSLLNTGSRRMTLPNE